MPLSPFTPTLRNGSILAMASFFLAMTLCTSVGTVLAESEIKTKNIVVSATRTEKDIQMAPTSISVVDQNDLKRSGYTSIADMLQDVPGVEVADQSMAGAKRLNIRGESGARVLIMVDGQKITEQKSMDGAPLLIDTEMIDRIEVVKGPASVLYGSEAIGGAVNIITKKGGTRPIQGAVSATYDTATDGNSESLTLSGGMDRFTYRVTGSYSDQGNRDTPDGELPESDFRRKSGSGYLGYTTDKFSVGLGLDAFKSRADSPPTIVQGWPFNLNLPEWSRQKGNLSIDVKDVTTKFKKIHMDAFAQKTQKDFEQRMDITAGSLGIVRQSLDTFNTQKTYGLNSQIDLIAHPDHYLVAGYSYTQDSLDADTKVTFDNPFVAAVGNMDYFYKASIGTHALFLQDEWMLPRNFILTIGGRQTWITSELEDTNDPNSSKNKVNDSQPVFSAGLTWSGIENLTIRGLASQGYRFPDLNQLYIGNRHGGGETLPNSKLTPETSTNFEIGARFNNDTWNIDITAFLSKAKDYITDQFVRSEPGSSRPGMVEIYQYTNVDEAQTHGVEAHIAYTFLPVNLTPYVTGTWMRRKYVDQELSTWNTGLPEFSGRLGLRWQKEMTHRDIILWADAWVRAAKSASDNTLRNGTRSVITTDGWETANLAVGCEFGKQQQYKVSLNLNNIFDHSYRTVKNLIDEPGFHGVLRVDVAF